MIIANTKGRVSTLAVDSDKDWNNREIANVKSLQVNKSLTIGNVKYEGILSDVFGVAIDTTNNDPEGAVTYTDAATGFVPMRGNNGKFSWGSWKLIFSQLAIRPCLFEDGEVKYYLNPDNFAETIDGDVADITSGGDGDVMIEIPKLYWKFDKIGDTRYVQFSKIPREGFVCLAHTRGSYEVDNIYISAYKASLASGKLRSLSGKTPANNYTKDQFTGYAQANGPGYEQFVFYQMLLMQVLYVIFFKSLDGQTALGRGNVDASSRKNTGIRDKDGMFYGKSTVGNNEPMKFCGIEDFWGNQIDWVEGLWSTRDTSPARKLWIATDKFEVVPYELVNDNWVDKDPKPAHYEEYGTGFSNNQDGYIKDVHGTNETGFVTCLPGGGSETTYYCDYATLRAGCVGTFGRNWNLAGHAGPFTLNVTYSPASADSYFGGRLTYIEEEI